MAGVGSDRVPTGLRALVASPTARAAGVLVILWLGTAILLHSSNDFGPMIGILACSTAVLWGAEHGTRDLVPAIVLWIALLVATVLILQESPQLPGMLALFGAAAIWFIVVESVLRWRSHG